MLFPIGDDNRDRHTTPVVNYILIALNIFVFIYWQKWGNDIPFTFAYSTVPAEILSGQDIVTQPRIIYDPVSGDAIQMPGLELTPIPVYLTLLTSMFMHGGIAHIAGNMLYLWIFGDNLENAMGHKRYLLTVDTNDLGKHIPGIMQDSRQYYRLAYVQPELAEGKAPSQPRRIEVEVDRPRVEVRARQRYVPKS
jgi:hypothetical protein